MNRHYSLFSSPSSRAKARREKFASTRKSLSESWEQTFPENAPFQALPSPTIGGESGIPERLSLALSPLARGRTEHQQQHSHHQSHHPQQQQQAHHSHHQGFFSSMMMASTTSDSGTTNTATATKASSLSSTSASSGSSSCSALPSSSLSSAKVGQQSQQQHKPQPKWSPRLQIVRQLSQPVLKTAEIVDTAKQQSAKTVSTVPSSSTSGTAAQLASSLNSSGSATTSKRSLAKHHSASSAGSSFDWSKDVSTQCNIFQQQRSSGEENRLVSGDGPPRTKSARLEKFRRCKSFDWDHFRYHCSSGGDPSLAQVAAALQDPYPPSGHKSVQQTWSGGSSSSSGGTNNTNAVCTATTSSSSYPVVASGSGNPREGGEDRTQGDPSSSSSSSRPCSHKHIIKSLSKTGAENSAENQGLLQTQQQSSSSSSSSSSIASGTRHLHDSSGAASVVKASTSSTSSPPASPRRFGLRAAMPNIFNFGKEKILNTGTLMRKKDPPSHLDLFGTKSTAPSAPPQPPNENTVFEKTVCKRCALLMPQLVAGQEENKPVLMQQQTQTDFSLLEEESIQEEKDGFSPKSSNTIVPSTSADTHTPSPVNSQGMKTGGVNVSSSNTPVTSTNTCSSPATASGTTAPTSSSVYICQKHQLLQQHGPTPIMSMPIMTEKKYVPSPLAQENRKPNVPAPSSAGTPAAAAAAVAIASTSRASEQHGGGPDSPGILVATSSPPPQHHYHQHHYHPHHHHHHQQQFQLKKHSLAFSLPIPQVALQYANIPSGDNTTPSSSSGGIRSATSAKDSLAASVTSAAAAAAAAEGRGKSSTLPTIDSKHIVAIRSAEKRRRFFAKKQTNSAPDTFDSHTFLTATQGVLHTTRRLCGNCKEPVTNCLDGVLRATRREKSDTSVFTPPSVEVWESEIRTARCGNVAVTHVSELDYPDADPPCHFCCEQASTAIHDASRLQIVSGGLVRSRDGSTRSGSAPYINLPSPNVQAENGQQSVFPSLELSPSMSQTLSPGSHYDHPANVERSSPPTRGGSLAGQSCGNRSSIGGKSVKEEDDPLVGPPASSLTRRPALVPPKLIPDPDYENDADRDKNSCRSSDDNTSPRARRSSIVVIPPMQICPGDLLVYGKCLSQRKSLLGTTIETPSPITSMLETETTTTRKTKATWSLLKLFERGSRPKGGPSGAIEEIMSLIQPCDYSDPKLTRFKGMCWADFVNHVTNQKVKKTGSVGSVTSGSSSEGSQSNQPIITTGTLTKGPKDQQEDDDNVSIGSGATLVTGHPVLTSTPSAPVTSTTSTTVATSSSATGTATTSSSAAAASSSTSSKAEQEKVSSTRSPKPLVRKRMGLMRTMSDRCLERRITPALFRGTQGFLMGEKLVEGKESEPTTSSSGKIKSEKDLSSTGSGKDGAAVSSAGSSGGGNIAISAPQQHQSAVAPPEESISDPDVRQKMRQKEALWDLFQSECSFLYDHLMVLKNVFMEPLKRIQVEGIAMYAEPELLFGNLDELCGVTYAFCKEFIHLLLKLTDATGDLSTTEVLAKLFEPSSKARAMSQAYHRYALNYINALNYLETLRRQGEFNEFEKLCMKDPRCKKLQLTDLLVSPVQHIMKVPLILKDIQSRTNEPQEKEIILQILEIQETSIRELDDKMKWLKNYERLLEIQRNIVWPSILEMEPKTWVPEFLRVALGRQPCDSIIVSPRRQIIHEGLLQLWDTGKPSETYVILFDDMLLITRRKKGLSKKKSSLTENWQSACGKSGSVVGSGLETNHRYIVYRQPISLDRFFIHDIAEAENPSAKLDYAFVLVALNRFQQIVAVHTFQAPSDSVKNVWLLKLKSTQEKWKRTLQTTVFRGVRSSTDSGQSNVASSLVFGLNKQFMRHNEA